MTNPTRRSVSKSSISPSSLYRLSVVAVAVLRPVFPGLNPSWQYGDPLSEVICSPCAFPSAGGGGRGTRRNRVFWAGSWRGGIVILLALQSFRGYAPC